MWGQPSSGDPEPYMGSAALGCPVERTSTPNKVLADNPMSFPSEPV